MKLNIKAFALACAILWGLSVLVLGLLARWFGIGLAWIDPISSLYRGFSVVYLGILIGTIWAFVDGLICGAIFAWLYNKLTKK